MNYKGETKRHELIQRALDFEVRYRDASIVEDILNGRTIDELKKNPIRVVDRTKKWVNDRVKELDNGD